MHDAFMDFGYRLRQARKAAGFESAADAARALGIPYPTYAGHENGSRDKFIGNLDLYARRFNVRSEWLRTGNGPMKTGKKPLVQEVYDELPPEKQAEVIRYMQFLKTS